MPIHDPRISPLIETLTASGLGWLADELQIAIEASGDPQESANTLEQTRHLVGQGRFEQARSEAPVPEAADGPGGDAQVEWAVEYVISRLEDATLMLGATLDNLGSIAAGESTVPSRASRDIVVILRDGESSFELNSANAGASQEAVSTLRGALEQWRNAVIAGDGDDS